MSETIQQLIDQGWIVLTDECSNELVGIMAVISRWNSMTWAERTYCRAKYGFNESGVLDIHVSKRTRRGTGVCFFGNLALGSNVVVPEKSTAGSNDRLRSLLAQNRVAVKLSIYDDTAFVHFGPDGSTVITAEFLWGLPNPNRDSDIGLNERYTCSWEISRCDLVPRSILVGCRTE